MEIDYYSNVLEINKSDILKNMDNSKKYYWEKL